MADDSVIRRSTRFREFLRTLKGRLIVTTCFFLVPTAVTLTMVIVQSTCNPKSWECSYMGPAFMFLGLGFSSAVFIVTIRYCRQLQLERQQQRAAAQEAMRWQETGYCVSEGDRHLQGDADANDREERPGNNSSVSCGRPAMIVYWIDGIPLSDSYAEASRVDPPPAYEEVAFRIRSSCGYDVPSASSLGASHSNPADRLDTNQSEVVTLADGKKSAPSASDNCDKDLPDYEEFLRDSTR